MKRWLTLLVAACVCVACLPMMTVTAAYDNTHVNTGNMAFDIVAVAESQIGYHEGSLTGDPSQSAQDNVQKYGAWYVNNVEDLGSPSFAWAAAFVSWCANQAGISSDIVYYHTYCPYGVAWFKNQGAFQAAASRGGSYVPKAGDIVYFAPAESELASHVGIVRFVKDGYVYTIEGNAVAPNGYQTDEGVFAKSYSLSYTRLLGYATPAYTTASIAEDTLTSETLTVENGIVGGVTPGTVAAMKANLVSAYTVTVWEGSETVADDSPVRTGQHIVITNGDTVVISYMVAVRGDYNGDGDADTSDARDLLRAVSTGTWSTAAQRVALGKTVDSGAGTSDARNLLRALIDA